VATTAVALGGGATLPTYGTKVFKSNNILVDMSIYGLPHDNVEGAAFSQGDLGKLIVVVSNSPSSEVIVSAYQFTMIEGAPSGGPSQMGSFTVPDAYMKIGSGMYFNRSGTKAVMTLHGGGDRATLQFDGSFTYELEVFGSPVTFTKDFGNNFSHSCDAASDGGNLGQWSSGSSYNYERYDYPEVRQLLYVDYVGDNQVRVELLYPEFTKTLSKSVSLSCSTYSFISSSVDEDGNTETVIGVKPTGMSEVIERSSTMAPMKILVNGEDIFTFEKGVDELDRWTYSHGGSSDRNGQGSYTITDTVNESREYLDTNTLFIDARTGALFFATKSRGRIGGGSSSGGPGIVQGYYDDDSYYFNQTYFEGRSIEATPAYAASTTRDLIEETITPADGPNKGVLAAREMRDARGGETGTFNILWSFDNGHPYHDMRFIPITQNGYIGGAVVQTLWKASSAGTSRAAVTSFVYYNKKEEQKKTINHFDTVTNPVGTIMERSGGDYFFLNVSVA
jgi:hypothetical protein